MINNRKRKLIFIFSFLIIITFFMLVLNSFGKLLFDRSSNDSSVWDGTSYDNEYSGHGTNSDPYLITNAAEFANFIKNASTFNYGVLFKLTTNIYINKGYFEKGSDKLYYYINNTKYTVIDGNYYDSSGTLVGNLNVLDTATNLSAILDGDGYSISGLYYNSLDDSYMIDTLSNKICNINFVNSYISGSGDVGLIHVVQNGTLENVNFKGILKNLGKQKDISYDITATPFYSRNDKVLNYRFTFDYNSLPSHYSYTNYTFSGNFANDVFTYYFLFIDGLDNGRINNGFRTFTSDHRVNKYEMYAYNPDLNSLSSYKIEYSDISAHVTANTDITAFVTRVNNNGTFNNVSVDGDFSGVNLVAGLAGFITGGINFDSVYNGANITSLNYAGGIVGVASNCGVSLTSGVNNGTIYGESDSGGLAAKVESGSFSISGKFVNTSNDLTHSNHFVGNNFNISNGYYTSGTNANGTYVSSSNLDSLNFDSRWIVAENTLRLTNSDFVAPNITLTLASYVWSSSDQNNNIATINIENPENINISITDSSDIVKVEFYHDDSNNNTLLDYNNLDYILYDSNTYYISKSSYNVLYFRVTDVFGNISYVHSDLIILDVFDVTFSKDIDYFSDEITHIDKNTKINYNFTHSLNSSVSIYSNNAKMFFESSIALPSGTMIYLYDNNSHMVFYYRVSLNDYITISGKYYYDLYNLINENNQHYTSNINSYYYNGSINQDFIIQLDFSNSSIINDYIKYTSGIAIIDNNSIKVNTVNKPEIIVYSSKKYSVDVNFNASSSTLSFNNLSDSSTISYNIIKSLAVDDGSNIYDGDYTSPNYSMKIEILDSSNNRSRMINNFSFNYSGETYYSNFDNYVLIPNIANSGNVVIKNLLNNVNGIKSGLYHSRFSIIDSYGNVVYSGNYLIYTCNNINNYSGYGLSVDTESGKANSKIYDKASSKFVNGSNVMDVVVKTSGAALSGVKKIDVTACLYRSSNVCETVDINSLMSSDITSGINLFTSTYSDDIKNIRFSNFNNNNLGIGIYRINVVVSVNNIVYGESGFKFTVK